MKAQKLFLVPELIRRARLRAGLSQKVLAASVGLDQSFICAVEKGRRRVHARQPLDAISRATGMTPGEMQALLWAWRHDRVVTEAQSVGLPETAQRLVSRGLQAAQHLEHRELVGLEHTINSALRSKLELTALAERSDSSDEEVHMS